MNKLLLPDERDFADIHKNIEMVILSWIIQCKHKESTEGMQGSQTVRREGQGMTLVREKKIWRFYADGRGHEPKNASNLQKTKR